MKNNKVQDSLSSKTQQCTIQTESLIPGQDLDRDTDSKQRNLKIDLGNGKYITQETEPFLSGGIGQLYKSFFEGEPFLIKILHEKHEQKAVKNLMLKNVNAYRETHSEVSSEDLQKIQQDSVAEYQKKQAGLFKLESEIFQMVHGKGTAFPFDSGIALKFFDFQDLTSTATQEHIGKFSTQESVAFSINLLTAFSKLPLQGICHFDLKPANILYCPTTGEFHIIDFGCSRLLPKDDVNYYIEYSSGTPEYKAPETALLGQAGFKSDICAMGKIIQEKIQSSGFSPRDNKQVQKFLNQMQGKTPAGALIGYASGSLIKGYMKTTYTHRPDINQALQFFKLIYSKLCALETSSVTVSSTKKNRKRHFNFLTTDQNKKSHAILVVSSPQAPR